MDRFIIKKMTETWTFWQVWDTKFGVMIGEFESYNYQAPMKRAKALAKELNDQHFSDQQKLVKA